MVKNTSLIFSELLFTVASKTRCLEDYASRLFWNSRNVPPSSILKTLNYFERTLLS